MLTDSTGEHSHTFSVTFNLDWKIFLEGGMQHKSAFISDFDTAGK